MKSRKVVISLSGRPMRVDGSGPMLSPVYDELDGLVMTYGREAVLRMFNEAKPTL
jgi:hypothetical protein